MQQATRREERRVGRLYSKYTQAPRGGPVSMSERMEERQGRSDGQKGTEKTWEWIPETGIPVPSPEKGRKKGGRGEAAFACGHRRSEARTGGGGRTSRSTTQRKIYLRPAGCEDAWDHSGQGARLSCDRPASALSPVTA